MSSTNTPLIDSYMTDYKNMMVEICVNPCLPVEMMLELSGYFETPSREELVVCMHEIHCKWCQDIVF